LWSADETKAEAISSEKELLRNKRITDRPEMRRNLQPPVYIFWMKDNKP